MIAADPVGARVGKTVIKRPTRMRLVIFCVIVFLLFTQSELVAVFYSPSHILTNANLAVQVRSLVVGLFALIYLSAKTTTKFVFLSWHL